jgi:phenylacetic acid degradation operon negative regulatory protein
MHATKTVSPGRSYADDVPRPRADAGVARWIRRTLAAEPPRARSLIVTVWGDALAPHGGRLWLHSLIRLMAPFGINDRLVRTSVFRLVRDRWIEAEPRGRRSRYHLTAAGRASFERAYRRVYEESSAAWTGGWDVVLIHADGDAVDRGDLREELRWSGFGAFAPNVYARPTSDERDPPPAPLAAQSCTLLRAGDVTATLPNRLAARVDDAYGLHAIAGEYRNFLARFGSVIDSFRALGASADPAQSFIVRTLLIHAYRRVSLRDPRLPAELLPLDWPGAAAHALTRDFYRITLHLAEQHLARVFSDDDEVLPPASDDFYGRFGGLLPGAAR